MIDTDLITTAITLILASVALALLGCLLFVADAWVRRRHRADAAGRRHPPARATATEREKQHA
ncbi:hypothetical protein [Actinorugispora endophytica]|uniref:Uncharacterized protein n=1 Tax=Actinorugispora endophytica TaxID=1605990 RepID=A0A4R6UW89_9ACTN|nr:hypothetical protein [Actinorugispora endophytica]TDQ50249.1 hypothetical protein EV190_11318 [Actinorugispora endophytica]